MNNANMSQNPENNIPLLAPTNNEGALDSRSVITLKILENYDNAIRKVFEDLSDIDLKPFCQILSQHEGVTLDAVGLADNMRSKLTDMLLKLNNNFFEVNDVDTKLMVLEELKTKFVAYEGTDWNVHNLSPDERTRPTRFRFHKKGIRFLEKKLELQKNALQVAVAYNQQKREELLLTVEGRRKLIAMMAQQTVKMPDISSRLKELRMQLL